jgi:hypothetical protein
VFSQNDRNPFNNFDHRTLAKLTNKNIKHGKNLTKFDQIQCDISRKKLGFLTSFSLSNKSTNLANQISYRKISDINLKASKIKNLRLYGKICSENPLTTSVLWKNFDQKVVFAGKWGMEAGKFWIFCGFDVHFVSFSV